VVVVLGWAGFEAHQWVAVVVVGAYRRVVLEEAYQWVRVSEVHRRLGFMLATQSIMASLLLRCSAKLVRLLAANRSSATILVDITISI
jgi:hypothetical protein